MPRAEAGRAAQAVKWCVGVHRMPEPEARRGLSTSRRYRFADVEIDLDAREIRRVGRRVDVEAKVFDLIELLLLARGRALRKDELVSALWGDRPVTDAALSQQLRKARRALGDDGGAQRVIRTVHGRGLRWVAEVVETGAADPARTDLATTKGGPVSGTSVAPAALPSGAGRRRRLAFVAVMAVALLVAVAGALLRYTPRADATAPIRLAVLPLADRTGEADLAWTREGLMGLMASLFAASERVEIVPAQHVRAVESSGASQADLARLRHALGATHFVAGELRRVGPLYELEIRLIAAGAAERSEVLHGSAPAPLAVDAVARVRRWLDLAPLPDTHASGIANAFLAEAYARGLDAESHGDHAGAKKYFEICLDHDPGLAWPRLALSVAQAASGDEAAAETNAAQTVAAARERGDRDLLVPALRQRASLAYRRGDLAVAAAYLDEALTLVSPQDQPLETSELLVGYASIEDERGEVAKARAHFEEALALARRTGNRRGEANVLANMASLDNGAGDAAGATARLREALDAARAAGDAALEGTILGNLGATEANQGHLLDAIALLKQAYALARARSDSHFEMRIGTQLVWVLAPFDRADEVRALARRVLALGAAANDRIAQAEAHWALAALAARRHAWQDAFVEFENARAIYAAEGLTRSLLPMLAELAAAADEAGDAARTRSAVDAFREAAGDAAEWQAWLPLLEAHLRGVGGDSAGAADDLARLLDAMPGPPAPVAQAALFQLGRWQLALGRADALLARAAWASWIEQHPDAIALRIEALRATGQASLAEDEQKRLDALHNSPGLALDPAWLASD